MIQMIERPTATLMPIGRYEWERLVRRIVMPQQHKLVALLLSTWADPDGSRVRPGIELVAASIGRSERTAAAVIRSLCRDWGLLEQVTRGGGRGGSGKTADYRLTLPTDLLDRHVLLDPNGRPDSPATQASGHSEDSQETLASGQSVDSPVDNSDSPEVQASAQSNGHRPIDRKSDSVTDRLTGSFQRLTGNPALPTTTHVTNHPKKPTPRSPTNSTTDRAREPPTPTTHPAKCDQHPTLAGGTDRRGRPRCPICRQRPPEPT